MPIKHIVTDQSISQSLIEKAKELRQNMTPSEQILWRYLRAGRLQRYHFRRQQIIHPYIVDFYCHEVALAVEVDGGVHLEQQDYDHNRDEFLQNIGLRVLRFTNHEVAQNLDGVLTAILDACQHPGERDPREY
jgi:very-short-patch-repair endonuclease